MSAISEELETLALSRNDASEQDELLTLTKRVAELEQSAERTTDWYQQRFNRLRTWVIEEVKPLSPETANRYFSICANGSPSPHESADWANTMHALKLQLERAEKRVAELEKELTQLQDSKCSLCGEELHAALDHISTLQSQLAWTPVEKGLPTEPGYYLFTDGHDEFPERWKKPEQDPGDFHWWCVNKRWYQSPLEYCGYTHYRRIELPEAK